MGFGVIRFENCLYGCNIPRRPYRNPMKSKGNKILITGGSSGIGMALAKKMSDEDNEVIILGRDQQRLDRVRSNRNRISSYVCDLSKGPERKKLIDYISSEHSDLNVLINNAGIQNNYSGYEDLGSRPDISAEVQVNLIAPMELATGLIPTLLGSQSSMIINVSSALAIAPKKNAPFYCATKAGLRSFTQSLRYLLEDTSIRVMELVPPVVNTPMTEGRDGFRIEPDVVADAFFKGFLRDQKEVYIGKAGMLRLLHRLSPSLSRQIVKNAD